MKGTTHILQEQKQTEALFPEDPDAPRSNYTSPGFQTTPMQVRKHPLRAMIKRKWTEYLVELLVVFLVGYLRSMAKKRWKRV